MALYTIDNIVPDVFGNIAPDAFGNMISDAISDIAPDAIGRNWIDTSDPSEHLRQYWFDVSPFTIDHI